MLPGPGDGDAADPAAGGGGGSDGRLPVVASGAGERCRGLGNLGAGVGCIGGGEGESAENLAV